jgi:hypothetical protein
MNVFNAFGGGEADTNDSLRYQAPKERRKSKPGKAKPTGSDTSVATESSSPSRAAASASASTTATTDAPLIVANSAVRLFKINASGKYEAHAGGVPLGCVIVRRGETYAVMVYDARKETQLILPLQVSFSYTVGDLYWSFYDQNRTGWSVLFDSKENMTDFLKSVAGVLAIIGQKLGPGGHTDCFKVMLACPAAEETSFALTQGSKAGLKIALYECLPNASEPSFWKGERLKYSMEASSQGRE